MNLVTVAGEGLRDRAGVGGNTPPNDFRWVLAAEETDTQRVAVHESSKTNPDHSRTDLSGKSVVARFDQARAPTDGGGTLLQAARQERMQDPKVFAAIPRFVTPGHIARVVA